ncbi:GntR family transcriptional regulator [Nocardia tengchongensis]|uniref:GntR family transcriptional regulator n=1 Tax=Nocardia tengchongensis TaxID=2055889 RepID=UPI003689EC2F
MPELEEVLPKYLQIVGYLTDQIVRGDLPPGAAVPSERDLAVNFGVARPTAQKALQELGRRGFVESRRGSGTYVLAQQAAPLARERLDRAAQLGTMYSDNESVTFPFVGIVEGPAHVTDAFRLPEGTPVVKRQRIIRNDATGELIELSTSWFTREVGEAAPKLLVAEKVGYGTPGYIAHATGIRATIGRNQSCARLATSEEREALGLPNPSAVSVFWLYTRDAADKVIAFDEAIYPPGRWSYQQEFRITL